MLAAWCVALAMSAAAPPSLQDGDRVVFLGDSITVAHTWTRAVEEFVRTRDAGKRVTFWNAGVGGHTAADGLARLDTDVLAMKPTVVVVNFGMNDASYPEGSDGAAFEKNMGAIVDRLLRAGVRLIVWADPTPWDPAPDGSDAHAGQGRARAQRMADAVDVVARECSRRGLVLVRWNEPVRAALSSWSKARRTEKLIPDRVHPAPLVHAVMATQVLRALGYTPAPVELHARVDESGVDVAGARLPWDGRGPLSLSFVDAPPPLVLADSDKDAKDLGAADVRALRGVRLVVSGLAPRRHFRVSLGDVDIGRVTGSELAAGFDLMASTNVASRGPAPSGTTMTAAAAPPPDFGVCDASGGNVFLRDHQCVWSRLFQKDQLRIAMRAEKTRWLPDFVGDRRAAFTSFVDGWASDAERAINATIAARRMAPHVVVVTPED